MDMTKVMVYTGLFLCLVGIALSIAANEWDGQRRFKLIITIILMAYLLVTALR